MVVFNFPTMRYLAESDILREKEKKKLNDLNVCLLNTLFAVAFIPWVDS